jgi:ABC-type lipoprotein release transport system permease subunit
MASLQYGVTIGDPLSWAVVLGLIGVTTIAASWRPARDAMRVDPVLLLKEE